MRIVDITTEERKQSEAIKAAIDETIGILNYDSDNLYPNHTKQVAQASSTASNCLKTYVRFLVGKGFKNKELNKIIVNKDKKLTLLSLLRNIAYDYALFRAMTTHINYNALGEKTSIDYVPFETARLGKPDDADYKNKIVLNKDWINREAKNDKKIFSYDSDKLVAIAQITSMLPELPDATLEQKINAYTGQIFYYSQSGGLTYPLSSIDSVLTDCSTEEGLSNISFRNVRYNFLASSILTRKRKAQERQVSEKIGEDGKLITTIIEPIADTFNDDLKALQGDKNTAKIIVVDYEFEEEKPELLPAEFANFDKAFTVTKETVAHDIGNIFNQPQIVRNEAVSGKLGSASEFVDGYNAYNNTTEFDRMELQEYVTELLRGFNDAPTGVSYEIDPLEYQIKDNTVAPELLKDLTVDERRALAGLEPLPATSVTNEKMLAETIGVGGTTAMVTILTDSILLPDQKRQLLIQLFNFTPENAALLIPIIPTV